jgi:predicted nuclease of predicted toxin-antitoxin system
VIERIRFHLDEHIDPDVAAALRRHGIDVTTTIDAGLRTASDDAQSEFAESERRVIVTDDADFIRRAATASDHPGIVVCHRQLHSTRQIIRGLILIYEVLAPSEIAGRTEFL